jgi:hypothetical protein
MENETNKQKLKMIAHDINGTLAILENAFNGIIENPRHKDDYRIFFDKGVARIRTAIENLQTPNQTPVPTQKSETP